MKDFIIEIYSEEIPARMQENAEQNFRNIYEAFFKNYKISYENLIVDIGPCRIVLHCKIQDILPSQSLEIKGPKVDANELAIEGFCNSNNISKEKLLIKKIKDQDFFFYVDAVPSQNTKEIIISSLPEYLNRIIWPKSMVWGKNNFPWVRPIKSILCLLGEEALKFKFANLESSNITYGHKFMRFKKLEVRDSEDYLKKLKENKVIISRKEREVIIKKSLAEICSELQVELNIDDKLLQEVTGLTEFPKVIYGRINDKFIKLPSEILITSMRHHQKYFTCNDKNNNLAPYFLFVTNLDLQDYKEIIAGNERVLSARLADALYFYNSDKTKSLKSYKAKLKDIIFHAKIGSLSDKVTRVQKLCNYIVPDDKDLQDAAEIMKSDLVSEMVCEFPELQGIMGSYYAKDEGYNLKICEAIKNHYKPIGIEDDTPKNAASILSIVDKIDSLVSLYNAGERATGSKDPFALRRYATGVVRTILDNKINLELKQIIDFALSLLENKNTNNIISSEIILFIEERFKHLLKQNFPHDVVNACINFKLNSNIFLSYSKLISLNETLQNEQGKNLASLFKRIKNIAGFSNSIEEINIGLFQTSSENILHDKIYEISDQIEILFNSNEFHACFLKLFELQIPLTKFFEENLVNTEDSELTKNRKALLSKSYLLFSKLANFDELQ